MKLVRGLRISGLCPQGACVTLGNFDGVHRGHMGLVDGVLAYARETGLTPALITFEPLPRAFFCPQNPPARLTRPADKLLALADAGIALTWVMPFGKALAAMGAEEFVRLALVQGIKARHIVIGEDFRFGARRVGDVDLLCRLGLEYGFSVATVPDYCQGETRISSSAIRAALAAGDMDAVRGMLGRPYRISGRVCRGEGMGRGLGFPTANIPLRRYPSPVHGIFAVRVRGVGGSEQPRPGVASVGTRPAIGGREWTLEAHLFDFSGDLYGQRIGVEFVARLREEQDFPDLDALTLQMRRDAVEARHILGLPDSPGPGQLLG